MSGRRIPAWPNLVLLVLLLATTACSRDRSSAGPEHQPPSAAEASGPEARWSYTITVDDALERMHSSLCIEGPRPLYLRAGGDEAIDFVLDARVRGGPALVREGRSYAVETLGEHGCVELEIDLDAALDSGGRDSIRRGDSALIAPDRWLWYPARVPEQLEARAKLDLPDGVHATLPWPHQAEGWRSLEHTSFGWNAWIVFSHRAPQVFMVGSTQFEVAVLDGPREASDAGIEAWIRASAAASVELHGAFPRERVAVAVIPTAAWGDSPVLFGVARRGGGGSVMLLLAEHAIDEELPGEWVATHELIHLGMPLISGSWMSEGFVTYYTDVLRARLGLLTRGDAEAQTRRALSKLASGFDNANSRTRTLQYASDNMQRLGSYRQVYWGGAAIALDLDVQLRHASDNRHGLDDLMRAMVGLSTHHRRYRAPEIVAFMDEQLAQWHQAGELEAEISVAEIVERHLEAKRAPEAVRTLDGLAVQRRDDGVELLSEPAVEVKIRDSMFQPRH